MRFNGVIESKLRTIEEKIAEIESWQIESVHQLRNNSMLRNAVERALQVAIEGMIDVCERILALKNLPASNTSSGAVQEVIDLGHLSPDSDYLDMVRFRNFIVHRYENIDIEIIFSIVNKKLPKFKQFVHEIRR